MGLQSGEYGVKSILRSEFAPHVRTVSDHSDVLGLARAFDRRDVAIIIDMTVSLHKFSAMDFAGMTHMFLKQLRRCASYAVCIVCVIDDPAKKPTAKMCCDSSRDLQRRLLVDKQRQDAKELSQLVNDHNVLVPRDDNFDENQLSGAVSCKPYVDDRTLRPRMIDILMHRVFSILVKEWDMLKFQCVLVMDAIGDVARRPHQDRNTIMLCSFPDAYPVNFDSLTKGEGMNCSRLPS